MALDLATAESQPLEEAISVPRDVPGTFASANNLLIYLIEKGEPPRQEIVTSLFEVEKAIGNGVWTAVLGTRLLTAYAELAKIAKPVTALSLSESQGPEAEKDFRRWRMLAGVLLPFTILVSAYSFAASQFAVDADQHIRTSYDIVSGRKEPFPPSPNVPPTSGTGDNQRQIVPGTSLPKDVLQASIYAELDRMFTDAVILRNFNFRITTVWFFEDGLAHPDEYMKSPNATEKLVNDARLIRIILNNTLASTETILGIINTYVLPLLCAVLGACAFGLRSLSEQTVARTFRISKIWFARVILAVIAGFAVGSLFVNFTAKLSLQPLAAAFVAGYAVEVFFIFLDSILQAMGKARGS